MILFTDISHWEDNPNTPEEIDFEKMRDAGARACLFKVSQGWNLDLVFRISWADCKGVLPRGGYCYLDWSKSGLSQAEFFCDAIAGDPPEMPLVVDFEERHNVPTNANGELWNWLTYVERRTGRIPWIYTSPDYWKLYGSGNAGWRKYPLHIANYQVNKPLIPAPWNDYVAWQYTDRGDGHKYGVEALGIDLNWLNKTEAEFAAMIGTPPPLPITLEDRVGRLEQEARAHGWNI